MPEPGATNPGPPPEVLERIAAYKGDEETQRQAAMSANTLMHSRIENDMSLHPPIDPAIGVLMDYTRQQFKTMAHFVTDCTTPGRDQSIAVESIEQALMDTIAAIARNQEACLPFAAQFAPVAAELAARQNGGQ